MSLSGVLGSCRSWALLGVVATALVAPVAFTGCSGSADTESRAAAAADDLPVDLLRKSWVMVVDDDAARAPFESQEGWARLIGGSKLQAATARFDEAGGLPSARGHAEAAALFRQAAWLSAQAILQTYGETAQPTDPAEMPHLLAVSHALAGDLDAAKADLAKLGELPADVAAWNAPWAAWLGSGAAWPPDLSGLPVGLPAAGSTAWPELDTAIHYRLKEQVEGEQYIDVYDPGALVALALWHDAAARTAAGDAAAVVDVWGARYRWPVEGPVAARDDLPLELLFGSDFLVPADGAFLAAVLAGEGAAAVDTFAPTSALAAIAAKSRTGGKIDPQKVIDLSASLRTWLVDTLKADNGGNTREFHRTFADQASIGVLRTLALVAEAEGEHENSGILRLNALERSSEEHTATPAYLLSMAAWDCGNRYPLRATEILHNLIRRFPSLETARFGVDALALRVSRERGPSIPGQ